MDDLTWGSPRFTTLVNNGDPSRRLDIAIIGDGYTESQQTQFRREVESVIKEFRETEPLRTYFQHLNFHRIDISSRQSGTNDMHAKPRPARARTALDTFYSPITDRRIIAIDGWVMTVATMSGAPWDSILVLVNYPVYGGATSLLMLVAYTTNSAAGRRGEIGSSFEKTAVHEAGHSIAKLIDEYAEDLPDIDVPLNWIPADFSPFPNVSVSGTNPKWLPWVAPGTLLPTPPPTTPLRTARSPIGAYEGAFNMVHDLYRPKFDCYMKNHGQPFCEVCSEQWIKVIYEKSPIADSFTPPADSVVPHFVTPTNRVTFHATLVRPEGVGIRTTWSTKRVEDASWRRRQRTTNYADFATAFPVNVAAEAPLPTVWQVRCVLEDLSPRLRQRHALRAATQEGVWSIVSSAQVMPHADTIVPHVDVSFTPHADTWLIPHGDVGVIGHGDVWLIPHADVAVGGHGDTPVIPHADGYLVPHVDIPAAVHGDIGFAAHGDTPVIPHGDVQGIIHGDVRLPPFPHVDTPSVGHLDTPALGHIDVAPTAHVDTPTVGHVDAAPSAHIDSAPVGHLDVPSVVHVDTLPQGHVDNPEIAHLDSLPTGHVDAAATAHLDVPPWHADAP